ncbi:death-associated inhibitor of apoptosis 2-like isoform X2 [Centroberyx affinis]
MEVDEVPLPYQNEEDESMEVDEVPLPHQCEIDPDGSNAVIVFGHLTFALCTLSADHSAGFAEAAVRTEEIHHQELDLACVVCLDEEAKIVYRPCRHLAACKTCDAHLNQCPYCLCEIASRVTVHRGNTEDADDEHRQGRNLFRCP